MKSVLLWYFRRGCVVVDRGPWVVFYQCLRFLIAVRAWYFRSGCVVILILPKVVL
jgi:hypothetical protein